VPFDVTCLPTVTTLLVINHLLAAAMIVVAILKLVVALALLYAISPLLVTALIFVVVQFCPLNNIFFVVISVAAPFPVTALHFVVDPLPY
jgi:hypothetical protein